MELILRIRENHETSHLPIIMLTTEGDEESRTAGFKAGATEYMIKPVSRDVLLARVLELVDLVDIVPSGPGD